MSKRVGASLCRTSDEIEVRCNGNADWVVVMVDTKMTVVTSKLVEVVARVPLWLASNIAIASKKLETLGRETWLDSLAPWLIV